MRALGTCGCRSAVLAAAAANAGAEGIVTRDTRGFTAADMPVLSPSEIVAILKAREEGV